MSEKAFLILIDLWQAFRFQIGGGKPYPAKRKHGRLFMFYLGCCLTCTWAVSASAQQFTIENASTELVDQVYILNANLKYGFSKDALQAIENGVSLILVLDIEVIKPRRYMWDEDIATLEQRYELQYLALANQYRLANKNSGASHLYPTLEDALASLEKINGLPLIDAHLLNKNERYKVQVRSRLDIDSLPVPLRLSAYFSGDWWLTSGWYSWDL
jgi:hypothetical protein